MSSPVEHNDGSILGQLLVEQGKMSKEVSDTRTDVAVIKERISAIPEHERRIRTLELARAKTTGMGIAAGVLSGGMATLIYWALQARR